MKVITITVGDENAGFESFSFLSEEDDLISNTIFKFASIIGNWNNEEIFHGVLARDSDLKEFELTSVTSMTKSIRGRYTISKFIV